jgi:hypothetical protein
MNAQRDAQQGGGTSNEQYALLGLFTSGTGYIYTHAPRTQRGLYRLSIPQWSPAMPPCRASWRADRLALTQSH